MSQPLNGEPLCTCRYILLRIFASKSSALTFKQKEGACVTSTHNSGQGSLDMTLEKLKYFQRLGYNF